MKTLKILSVLFLAFTISSCASVKSGTDNMLYGNQWELEYITGPRIAFQGLYPDKKPTVTFSQAENKVTGNSGCNGYNTDIKVDGNKINFAEPGISTMMYCGEGEKVFLNTIKKVNAYSLDSEGKLVLLMGDIAVMRFKKIN